MKKLKAPFICGIFFLVLFCSTLFSNTNTIINRAKRYNVSSSDIASKSGMFVDASLEFGVPASILIAMAIEETSFGTKGVGVSLNNWFGIEKTSLYPTDPNYTGRFEKYPNARASIRDAARLLGSPKSSYKITNIIINNGGLDGAYDKIARSITAHWCVNEPGAPCSYDAQKLLDDIEKYDLTKYDEKLKNLSVDEIKAILDKYYGPNAIPIPGYDGVQNDWSGDYTEPDLSDNIVDGIYFNTSYYGDITEGYIYKKYAELPMWGNIGTDSDEKKVDTIIRRTFIQGEELYGDGVLHADDFLFMKTENTPPPSNVPTGNGTPLSCYVRISSSFNDQESFRNAKHKGLDLAAPVGTKIYSVTSGQVIATHTGCPPVGYYGSKCGGGYGNHIKIRGVDGKVYIYAHMQTGPLFKKGDQVVKGSHIGIVGSSGSSTGPHLHFEVKQNNVSINPLPYSNYTNIPKCGGG